MTRQDHISVVAGEDLDETWDIADKATGTWVAWPPDTEAAAEFRDRDGTLLARSANFGTRDGDINLLSDGQLQVTLPGAITADLPITRPYTNNTDPHVAGRRHRRAHVFDIRITATFDGDDDPTEAKPVIGLLTVNEPVTE